MQVLGFPSFLQCVMPVSKDFNACCHVLQKMGRRNETQTAALLLLGVSVEAFGRGRNIDTDTVDFTVSS